MLLYLDINKINEIFHETAHHRSISQMFKKIKYILFYTQTVLHKKWFKAKQVIFFKKDIHPNRCGTDANNV